MMKYVTGVLVDVMVVLIFWGNNKVQSDTVQWCENCRTVSFGFYRRP